MKKILPVIIALVVAAIAFLAFNMIKKSGLSFASSGGASALLGKAKEMESKGELLEAKAVYQKLLSDYTSSSEMPNWQRRLDDINLKLIFSPVITPKSVSYEIKPGDTLDKIAKANRTTVELIKKSNGLADDRIVPGRKLKIWSSPFSILVYKGQNLLIVKAEDEIIKTYVVSTGLNGCTPVGTFKIVNKLVNPTWFKAGAVVPSGSPANVLGTRWMGFNAAGYGIHGTVQPEMLGKAVTEGCVRMANNEVEELYALIPVGSEVTIVD